MCRRGRRRRCGMQGLYVEMKFERPSKVQAKTLPMILMPPHKDLIAQAHNGSGKTTCFVLSMLSRCGPRGAEGGGGERTRARV